MCMFVYVPNQFKSTTIPYRVVAGALADFTKQNLNQDVAITFVQQRMACGRGAEGILPPTSVSLQSQGVAGTSLTTKNFMTEWCWGANVSGAGWPMLAATGSYPPSGLSKPAHSTPKGYLEQAAGS